MQLPEIAVIEKSLRALSKNSCTGDRPLPSSSEVHEAILDASGALTD